MIEYLPFDMGIVAFALDGGLDNPDAKSLVEKLRQLEIPGEKRFVELLAMPTTDPKNIEKIAESLGRADYGRTICGFRPGDDTPDMMSADRGEVGTAIQQVYHIMRCAEAAGATRIGGPLFRNHGNLTKGDGKYLKYALDKIVEKAEQKKIYVSQEMLVAWETTGFNCLANTLRVIKETGSDYLLIHFDTAHASREESDIISSATELYKSGKFGHCHISENGRGPIGAGPVSEKLVPFMQNLAALGYGNNGEKVIVELFHPSMYGAVKRVDKIGIGSAELEVQNALAFQEAQQSFRRINNAYQTVCKTMTGM